MKGAGSEGGLNFQADNAQGSGKIKTALSPMLNAAWSQPALTSPSLPSQGSLAIMAGKDPPPTGAVEPRPKDSSLGENNQTYTFMMSADEQSTINKRINNSFKRVICLLCAQRGISCPLMQDMPKKKLRTVLSFQLWTIPQPGGTLLWSLNLIRAGIKMLST